MLILKYTQTHTDTHAKCFIRKYFFVCFLVRNWILSKYSIPIGSTPYSTSILTTTQNLFDFMLCFCLFRLFLFILFTWKYFAIRVTESERARERRNGTCTLHDNQNKYTNANVEYHRHTHTQWIKNAAAL